MSVACKQSWLGNPTVPCSVALTEFQWEILRPGGPGPNFAWCEQLIHSFCVEAILHLGVQIKDHIRMLGFR